MAVSGDKRKDLYWRSSQSGGRATVMNRNPHGQRNLSQIGDVSSIAVEGSWLTDQYLIECKHQRDIQLPLFLIHQGGRIAKWVKTARQQADGKEFLLIMKQNNIPTLVLTDASSIGQGTMSRNFLPLLTTHHPLRLVKFDYLLTLLRPATERRRPKS